MFHYYGGMTLNQESGKYGEQLASDFLRNLGWDIRELNYRYKHAEIDIVAVSGNLMIFVEVKTRKSRSFGHPEDFVDHRKSELIIRAADHYINQMNWQGNIRFDIVAVITGKDVEIVHFEDAFY